MKKFIFLITFFSLSFICRGQNDTDKVNSGFIIPARENYLSDKADLFSTSEEAAILKMADSIYTARKIRY
jgi:hypothetical protein